MEICRCRIWGQMNLHRSVTVALNDDAGRPVATGVASHVIRLLAIGLAEIGPHIKETLVGGNRQCRLPEIDVTRKPDKTQRSLGTP
jgi:hypothetical protein